ncbi:WYL domain-containing protein [Trinickia caryophylli]|uniref:Predicted DNA-binding transcriptional regulator YafY, contains an HTH and WYL domains n=1 Tax=Trinickia caryophylli TaxID=28094 RepID=A0A1X7DE60_TRICW|nr:WYL domain-containing protein [Trinickia caryophylli]PMS09778.1 WYL domain-containing protein [Trinickia caryophylli]TRX16842.1 WYL domain-containing protein [Trinickia caryophylli]WQE12429.1 WYL domain-containing protein [Trinickia caryophylli]SMF13519.1 Predicted DNA-binding transcriptional regulator YafY, contains an HTH and WYL domains [Trinickia caryophylli]GLU31422.1 transcriptional regulator [Trinickia caryophylli]
MSTSRLISTLLLLQMRGRVTARALAEEFEVSVRTVYRDIDQLSAAGIPVYADRGPGGGFTLLGGYRTDLTGMTRAEAEMLQIGGLAGAASELGLTEALRTAQLKLVAALPDAGAQGSRIGSRLHIDPVDWYRRAQPAAHLPQLAHAVFEQRRIAMQYASWKTVSRRRCDPLGLVLKAGNWYLVAALGARLRIFKVAAMTALEVLDERFERPADFDLRRIWTEEVDRFERGLLKGRATLRVTRDGMAALHHLGAAAAEQAVCGPFDGEGWSEVSVPIEDTGQAAMQLLRLGPHVRVVEPGALRAQLRQLAKRVAALNGP